MNSKLACAAALLLTFGVLHADTAAAQQTVNLSFGAFMPRGEDARVAGDVLVEDLNVFVFDVKDFTSPSLTGEWLVPVGDYFEVGAGIGFASRTVPTIYQGFTRPNGSEIEQEIKLRTIPIAGTVRVLPFGRNRAVQPYIGGGIGVTNWRYSETGDFVDFSQSSRPIFHDSYTATGNAVGPVAVFGLRMPVGNFSFGGEMRYQKAEGNLDERDFFGPKLDLGGFHYVGTFGVRF